MSEKLQKVLARAGLGSRREIETWIEEGRLVVNGYPALLGTRVEPKDEVKLDGRRLKLIPESLVNRKILMYHKPEGEVTTRKDPEGRPTVFDRLPPMRGSRWVAIGRLDLNTSGLLLFTNDGEVANRLMHPSHEVEREYAVRILGELKPAQRKKLLEGVLLEDGLAKFNSIESRGGGGSNRWYHVTLSEGRTREVRRMFESMDLVVSRLIRVRYGPVALDPLLKQGMNRELNLDETNRLCEAVGIEPQAPRAERRREYQQSRRSETVAVHSDFAEADTSVRSSASSRKPKVIGNKDDDLPLDRVERAAELLRRRRAAESAGVDFSGRNRRLSGKRTLRESELRKIAQDKAAEKAAEKTKRGERDSGAESGAAASRGRVATRGASEERTPSARTATGRSTTARTTTARTTSARTATARTTTDRASARAATGTRTASARSSTGTRSSRSSEAGASTGRSTASRSPGTRTSTARSSSRSGPVRAVARTDRDDDDFAPRRSARPTTRSHDADEETPRRRSATKPTARASADRDERPARSRAAAGSADRAGRSSGGRAKPAATGRTTGERASTARSASSRSSGERSKSTGKPAGRASGKPARAGGASRGAGKSAAAKPAGKGKRTR